MNITDGYGYPHNHEVPANGQFRLRSACQGCDRNQVHATVTGRHVTWTQADRILAERGM